MLETYRGIPHLLDTWLVLTGMALPIALSKLRRPGDLLPRLAAFCLPGALALVLAATLSPTAHNFGRVGQCGTYLTTTGGLTSIQGLLNVLLFVPAAGMLTLASGRPGDGIAAGIGMSARSRPSRPWSRNSAAPASSTTWSPTRSAPSPASAWPPACRP